jgi:O-antigen/teichoic acid export membrane protein
LLTPPAELICWLTNTRTMSEVSTPAGESSNNAKTLVALLWMYGGRGVGMLWTLALVGRLGVANYGLYGMGYALSAVVGPPLDNSFQVRAMRESEERFQAERTTRYLLGAILTAGGIALIGVEYIAWFGLVVAGGEMACNAWLSQDIRDGHPERFWRVGSIRQTASVAIACAYMFGVSDPTLQVATLLYCSQYVVIFILGGVKIIGHRPGMPGSPRLIAALTAETLGMCLYLQGDVLLLGYLTDNTTVGYYTLTVTVTVALAAAGQAYGMTFHEPLRQSGGDLSTGPRLRNTLILGGATGLLVLVTGIALLVSPAPTELAVAMLLMAAFCAMRTMSSVLQVILYAQRRDVVRLVANLGLVPVKLGLVAALANFGAVGAAVATVITDAVILTVYLTTIYRKKADRPQVG